MARPASIKIQASDERLAHLTEEDVARAVRAWAAAVPPRYANLLLAGGPAELQLPAWEEEGDATV